MTENKLLDEKLYIEKVHDVDVYICQKKDYNKKIAMFGTKYGSIESSFNIGKTRYDVPEGIAHFLEHKLFENENSNSLDLFAKEGISANAYTSFDHTVYYFETITKFKKGLEMLVDLVKTTYLTDENVEKEKGIIGQEISMYEDDAKYVLYYNTLQGMYVNNPVNIDIAGTVQTISKITKEDLTLCYNTFYSNNNMYIVVVGDVDKDEVIADISKHLEKYNLNTCDYTLNLKEEPKNIKNKYVVKNMDVNKTLISVGYKMDINQNIILNDVISKIINEMYFSASSKFYNDQYLKGNVLEDISFGYEGAKTFSHTLISTSVKDEKEFENDLNKYIEEIKNKEVDEELFINAKRKIKGEIIMDTEDISSSYRRIINAIITETDVYAETKYLDSVNKYDIKQFLNKLVEDSKSIAIIKSK